MPVTDENSSPVNFGGRVLNLPLALFQGGRPVDQSWPVFSFVYWYPSITPGERDLLGGGSPPPDLPPDWRPGTSEPNVPLRVWVEQVYYSDDAEPNRFPRPSEYVSTWTRINGALPHIADTPFPGLRHIWWEESGVKRHPEDARLNRPPWSEGLYIQTADRPYELYLAFGPSCYFKLYNPKTHIQADGHINLLGDYAMGGDPNWKGVGPLTPALASKIVEDLNRMLENWASVPRKTSNISRAPAH